MFLLSSMMFVAFEIHPVKSSELIEAQDDGTHTLTLEGSASWQWKSTTIINAVAYGDFNGGWQTEIVTGGYYFDGTRNNAQLVIWNSTSLVAEKYTTWYWSGNTTISSIAVGDVNGDGQVEIVTGGYYFDGTRNNAQLIVWNASNLAEENVTSWYWTGDTVINSIAIDDVDSDGLKEIVSAGYYNDGVKNIGQLAVWSGRTLALEKVKSRYWIGNTVFNSVGIGDVDNDGQGEIVTGGYFFDGTIKVAQLIEWTGADLVVDRLLSWFWTGNTVIDSVAIGDVDNDGQTEITTSGFYNNGTQNIAQLIEWKGSNLSVERQTEWNKTDNMVINSVAIGDINGDGKIEIITSGYHFDGTRNNAQLIVWSGSNLVVENVKTWYWINDTSINSAVAGDINGDLLTDIIAGGEYFNGTHLSAQLTLWDFEDNQSQNNNGIGLDFSPTALVILLAVIIAIVITIVISVRLLRKRCTVINQ